MITHPERHQRQIITVGVVGAILIVMAILGFTSHRSEPTTITAPVAVTQVDPAVNDPCYNQETEWLFRMIDSRGSRFSEALHTLGKGPDFDLVATHWYDLMVMLNTSGERPMVAKADVIVRSYCGLPPEVPVR